MIRQSNILVSIWTYLFLFFKIQNLNVCLLLFLPFVYRRLKLLSNFLRNMILSCSFFIVRHYDHFVKMFD